MNKLSHCFFAGLCFLIVSCSVLSGGGSGDTDTEKYEKDLSFPLNEEHFFYLTSSTQDVNGSNFLILGVVLGVDIVTISSMYKESSDHNERYEKLIATWLKNQYSDGTRNSEVTLMRFVFAVHVSVGISKSEILLEKWKDEYCPNLDIEVAKKLVDDEYDVWKKAYKEHLHSTCGDVYNKAIETADWAYLIVTFNLLHKVNISFFIFLLSDHMGDITESIENSYRRLGQIGQAFLMFEKWVCDQGKKATFKILLQGLTKKKLITIKNNICKDFCFEGI